MLKSGSLRHVTSRHVTSRDTRFISVHDNRTPIGSKLPIMGEFFLHMHMHVHVHMCVCTWYFRIEPWLGSDGNFFGQAPAGVSPCQKNFTLP